MVDSKKIGIAGAAVVLVTLVTIFGTSYMADFENNPRNVSQNDSQENKLKAIELKHAPVLGSDTATVTIVEVGDYQCHMCKKWFEETRPLIIDNYINTGKVNLVFIDMPFLGYDSTPASEATYCADDQGRYWDYHSALFEYQQEIDDGWEIHPASAHMNYLSDDAGDDPLLAVCAQAILLHLEVKDAEGESPITLESLGLALVPRGIDSEELVEALEWLLEQGTIIEVGENEFVLG